MIKLLPHWVYTNRTASFYDVESVNIMEATGQLQGKMNELINDYNKFVDDVNKAIVDFTTSAEQDSECFKKTITSLIEDYIKSIDLKVSNQDMKIASQNTIIAEQNEKIDGAVKYFKDEVDNTITTLINDMKTSGEFDEAVLNALDNIQTSYTSLDVRVTTLENTTYALVYDSYTEELRLEKTVGGES